LRAGVQSVDRGQTDASIALGMSYFQRMKRIILPQALRRMVPPLMGQTIMQLKNTTLLSVLTIPDLLYQAGYISSFTYKPMEVYTAIGVLFIVLLFPLSALSRRFERKEAA
jgi:polar amino acid transport system permease protein